MEHKQEASSLDLASLRPLIDEDADAVLRDVLFRVERYPDSAVWTARLPEEQVLMQLQKAKARRQSGETLPLFGVPFAIKDNMDVAGLPTTAACPDFTYVAKATATAVRRLIEAGAILIGKTNLDQFATGLVGVRSPYGACRNPFDPRYISGGSSSGSAVAVSAGLVSFSLGTDTAGSGRVPAGFCNLVGLKPTRGLVSAAGVVPACRTLDCVSVFGLNTDDAFEVLQVIAGRDDADPYSRAAPLHWAAAQPPRVWRFGVPRSPMKFFGDSEYERLFGESIERMRQLGGELVEIDYTPLEQAANLLYSGPWVAERYAAVKDLIERSPQSLLPVTRSIIARGKEIGAVATFEAMYQLEHLRAAAQRMWRDVDVLLLPTTGTIYTIEQVQADPIALNTHLGYYTNFVNLLDCSAAAVPAGMTASGLPFGVTLVAPAWRDAIIARLGQRMQTATGLPMGATRCPLPLPISSAAKPDAASAAHGNVLLAVVGAHLSGQPLNWQLTQRGGVLVRTCRTAATYKLFALAGTKPAKPGLIRGATGEVGAAIEVELWQLSHEAFGSFVADIPSPLGIGTLTLEDGSQVKGFLCEPFGVAGAEDISHLGGWRAFLAQGNTGQAPLLNG